MNFEVLKAAETFFLERYPGGFAHEDMVAIGKKHRMDKLESLAHELFSKDNFTASNMSPDAILEGLVTLAKRSTLISLFEKPKFRDAMKATSSEERIELAFAVQNLLHGDEERGFNAFVDMLQSYKLGKWTLTTFLQAYYCPTEAVFIKPTTTKLIIDQLELDLIYSPTPSWEFYVKFRETISKLKSRCDPSLCINNPAFTGFLMMSLPAVTERETASKHV